MTLARIPRGWRMLARRLVRAGRLACARREAAWPLKRKKGRVGAPGPSRSNPPGSLGLNQTGAGVTSRSAISCEARADARKARVLRLAFQVASRGNFTFGDGGVAYGCGHSSSRLGSRLFKKAHK